MRVDLTEAWDLADIVFVIEDKKLYVNKTILMMSSDVFKVMFTADFREKDLTEIPIPGKDFDSFLLLMKVIHPPNMEVNGTTALQLLPLSHEYEIHHVTSSCEKVLLTEPPSVQNLVLADRYSLLHLRKASLLYTRYAPLTQLEAEPGFDEVQPDTMIEVLRHKVLQKEFLCDLMSRPPSVQNLVLAEKYNIPQLKETCIKYAKNKPLSQLKNELDKITPATLIEILKRKVIEMEPKVQRLDALEPELKTMLSTLDKMNSLITTGVLGEGICPLSVDKSEQHKLGSCGNRKGLTGKCLECRRFTLNKIANISFDALNRLHDCYIKYP